MSEKQRSASVVWPIAVVAVILAANWIEPVAAYLDYRWPVLGLGGALAIVMALTAQGRDTLAGDELTRLNWWLLAAYLVHPFEVNGVDIFGREFHFLGMMNEMRGTELVPRDLFRLNTVGIWLQYPIAIWAGERYRWTGLAAAGVMLGNGLFHTATAVTAGAYNPGLATSLVVFLPLGVLYYRHARNVVGVSWMEIASALLFGIGGHLLVPVILAWNVPMAMLLPFALFPITVSVIAKRLGKPGPSAGETQRTVSRL